jgi:hypothetical protein
VNPVCERGVLAVAATDIHLIGIWEPGRVPVRGAERQQHGVAAANAPPAELDIMMRLAADVLQRRLVS